MLLVYPGPGDGVDVPGVGVTAVAGEPVEIPDPDVAKSLLAQGWLKAEKPTKAKKET